jgi:alpha-beta hydrolase superfamily lysophospholipase
MTITEHTVKTDRHTSFYLAAGPENGPLIIFIHGWPELSISWRHQLPALAALGFRAIAPDMRGYGRSTVYNKKGEYAQEHIVRDMLDLLDSLGRDKAVWVGHDWKSGSLEYREPSSRAMRRGREPVRPLVQWLATSVPTVWPRPS